MLKKAKVKISFTSPAVYSIYQNQCGGEGERERLTSM